MRFLTRTALPAILALGVLGACGDSGLNKEADAERKKKIDLHLSLADIATLEAKYQKTPAIQQIQDTFNQTRMQVVDLLAQSGRISKEQADDWKANSAYVPFDRVFEDLGVNLLPRGKGLGVMTKTPEIKGSLDRRVKNVVDSYMGTLGWMVEEAMRHNASTKLLDEMQLAGFAEKHPTINAAKNKNLVVRLYEDGKPVFYEVQNEYDLLAFRCRTPLSCGNEDFVQHAAHLLWRSARAQVPCRQAHGRTRHCG